MTEDRSRRSDGGRVDDEPPLGELLTTLASELRATEELPVSPAASVWLGEAHAVADDLVYDDVDRAVIHDRVGYVRHLLTSAGDLDNETATERVGAALTVAETIHERTRDATDDG